MALIARVGISCLALLMLGGCAGAPTEPSTAPTAIDFAARAQSALDDAKIHGASAQQLEIIEDAIATGEISFESVQSAVDATFACFEAAGIRYQVFAPQVQNGISYPNYAFEGERETPVADSCIHANSDYVEALYAGQSAAVEANDAAFEAAMPAIIDCMQGLGYDIDDTATIDELKSLLVMRVDDVGTPNEQKALDRFKCVNDAGISSF